MRSITDRDQIYSGQNSVSGHYQIKLLSLKVSSILVDSAVTLSEDKRHSNPLERLGNLPDPMIDSQKIWVVRRLYKSVHNSQHSSQLAIEKNIATVPK